MLREALNIFARLRNWLSKPGTTLSRRVAHGGIWAFLVNGADKLLRLVRIVLLARLLAPEDFGLFGITMLALSAVDRFTRTGFAAALIQKQEDVSDDLDTAWIIQIARGLFLAVVLIVAAPWVASFFNEPNAANLIRVLALVVAIRGLKNIGVVYFRKEIEFHKQFLFRLSATVPDLLVSVGAALFLRNAWALVFGLVGGSLAQTALSYWLHPYRPRLQFDFQRAKDLFNFGKYITGQSMVLFLLNEGDDALVGKVLGATPLGLYQVAYRLSNVAATQITHVISQVTFPAYAKVQDYPEKLHRGLRRTLAVTAFLTLPVAAALAVLAPEITEMVLGQDWMPMVPAMQVMCLFGAMRALGATFGPVYRAVARVDIPLKISLIQLLILACIIYPMILKWGILGASGAITFAVIFSLISTSIMAARIIELRVTDLYASILPAIAGMTTSSVIVALLKTLAWPLDPTFKLMILLVTGGFVYLAVVAGTFWFAGYSIEDLRALVHSLIGKSR